MHQSAGATHGTLSMNCAHLSLLSARSAYLTCEHSRQVSALGENHSFSGLNQHTTNTTCLYTYKAAQTQDSERSHPTTVETNYVHKWTTKHCILREKFLYSPMRCSPSFTQGLRKEVMLFHARKASKSQAQACRGFVRVRFLPVAMNMLHACSRRGSAGHLPQLFRVSCFPQQKTCIHVVHGAKQHKCTC